MTMRLFSRNDRPVPAATLARREEARARGVRKSAARSHVAGNHEVAGALEGIAAHAYR